MNDFVNDLEVRFQAVSRQEVEEAIARAHHLRNQAMRDALSGFWGLLRRSVAARPAARHA